MSSGTASSDSGALSVGESVRLCCCDSDGNGNGAALLDGDSESEALCIGMFEVLEMEDSETLGEDGGETLYGCNDSEARSGVDREEPIGGVGDALNVSDSEALSGGKILGIGNGEAL